MEYSKKLKGIDFHHTKMVEAITQPHFSPLAQKEPTSSFRLLRRIRTAHFHFLILKITRKKTTRKFSHLHSFRINHKWLYVMTLIVQLIHNRNPHTRHHQNQVRNFRIILTCGALKRHLRSSRIKIRKRRYCPKWGNNFKILSCL